MKISKKLAVKAAVVLAGFGLLASAPSGASAAQARPHVVVHGCTYSGRGGPGIISYRVYVIADTCGLSYHYGMRAYTWCTVWFPGPRNVWSTGPTVYRAGNTSKAQCPAFTDGLAEWGYQFQFRLAAPGHRLVWGHVKLGSS